jgi:hydroxymethylpyrimidine pyrophosphatase-like HAD family hydrolase
MFIGMIQFNPLIKLVLADVDETVADVYTPATKEMIDELNLFLAEERVLFLISGGGLQSIRERIVDKLKSEFRHLVLVAPCCGAEVWGFEKGGEINRKPFYSMYEGHFTDEQKKTWREVINRLIETFHLKTYEPQPRVDFTKASYSDPLSIMLSDRGSQITFEFTNSINLTSEQKNAVEKELGITIPLTHETYDLRYVVMEEASRLYKKADLPIHPHLGGMFALDFIIDGVNKTRAVKHVLEDKKILVGVGLNRDFIQDAHEVEIWGDKFAQKKGGPDFEMCLAVSPAVRAIDFRQEGVDDLPKGYNIQMWDGKRFLHDGLVEYLQTRHV